MATRDRTALFLRYRAEARSLHNNPRSEQFMNNSNRSSSSSSTRTLKTPSSTSLPNGIDLHFLPNNNTSPAWMTAFIDLQQTVSDIERDLAALAAAHATHLLPSFGALRERDMLERDIRAQMHALTALLHDAQQRVRDLANVGKDAMEEEGSAEICRNLQKRFAKKLQLLSTELRRKQKAYLDDLRVQREVTGAVSGAQESAIIGQGEMFDDEGMQQVLLAEVDDARVTARERDVELKKVSENINDLAVLVKDLAALVVDQGTVLDRIDYNIESAGVSTKGAVRELRVAENYQRKRQAFCCILVLAVACGVLGILLILKWTS